jgi:hypothetical protein
MLNPFNSPSREFFGDNRMSQMVGAAKDAAAGALIGEIDNQGYLSAARRAEEYRKKNQIKPPGMGSQIATAAAGAAVSAGIALI